jgi:hypothetical protein
MNERGLGLGRDEAEAGAMNEVMSEVATLLIHDCGDVTNMWRHYDLNASSLDAPVLELL